MLCLLHELTNPSVREFLTVHHWWQGQLLRFMAVDSCSPQPEHRSAPHHPIYVCATCNRRLPNILPNHDLTSTARLIPIVYYNTAVPVDTQNADLTKTRPVQSIRKNAGLDAKQANKQTHNQRHHKSVAPPGFAETPLLPPALTESVWSRTRRPVQPLLRRGHGNLITLKLSYLGHR